MSRLLTLAAGLLAAILLGCAKPTVETAASERFVSVAGLEVRVREEGPRNAPKILMLHGFTFSLESFDALAEDLSTDYHVIRYDLRGHGLTGPDPQKRYSPEERAAHVGQVLDALGIQRATVVGNSLGGLAAWRFAAREPSRTDGLVLISAGGYPMNGVSAEPAPVPAAIDAYFRTLPDAAIAFSLGRVYASSDMPTPERFAEIAAMMREDGNGEAFIDALKVFTLPDPEPILTQIKTPALVIWGEEDQLIDPDHGRRMADTLPNAELVLLPGVGHVPQEEAPNAVSREVRAFLTENSVER